MTDLKDFRDEANRLINSAESAKSISEKRMLATQATFYETIAAQEDSLLKEQQDKARRREPEELAQRS